MEMKYAETDDASIGDFPSNIIKHRTHSKIWYSHRICPIQHGIGWCSNNADH